MGFTDAIKAGFQKYFDFETRASRSEYWFWILFVVLVSIGLAMIDLAGDLTFGEKGLLSSLFSLGMFIPNIAVGVRRLHDRDMSGWWFLIVLIPAVGGLALIVLFCMKGTEGDNRFGPDPLIVPDQPPVIQ